MSTAQQRQENIAALRKIYLAAEEALLGGEQLTREQLVSRACQYGRSSRLEPAQVERILCESVQCLVLPNEEWS